MEYLNKPCQNCNQSMNGGVYRAPHICPHCLFEHESNSSKRKGSSSSKAARQPVRPELPVVEEMPGAGSVSDYAEEITAQAEPVSEVSAEVETLAAAIAPEVEESAPQVQEPSIDETLKPVQIAPSQVVLTAKSSDDYVILEVLDDISAECTLKIKLTPDLIKDGKFVGAKSEKVKAALAQGQKHALLQIRQKAQAMGANLVSGISVKNAVKAADKDTVSIAVKAEGCAHVAELEPDLCEA